MDIVALGEILIDFVELDDLSGPLPAYVVQPGGAPANVLCIATKFSKRCAFIGKVGQDKFGDLLMKTLEEHNVETKHVISSSEYNTTLAFVHLEAKGERSFSFYREGCADTMLVKDEIDVSLLEECKVFHFGSNSLITDVNKYSTEYALKIAKQKGAIISFDPNIRTNLWKDTSKIQPAIHKSLSIKSVLHKIPYNQCSNKKSVNATTTTFTDFSLPPNLHLGTLFCMSLYSLNKCINRTRSRFYLLLCLGF